MIKKCIECGINYKFDPKIEEHPKLKNNRHWCPICDQKRVAKVSKQIDDILKSFGGKNA